MRYRMYISWSIKTESMRWIFMIQSVIYGYIAIYDVHVGSRGAIAWALMSIFNLGFYIAEDIKQYIDKTLKQKQ